MKKPQEHSANMKPVVKKAGVGKFNWGNDLENVQAIEHKEPEPRLQVKQKGS